MPRTTATLIRGVIAGAETAELSQFISLANSTVSRFCDNGMQTEGTLTEIETWLAAHFYAVYEPQVEAEGAGPVNAKYRGKTDMGLAATLHGQQAMFLDRSGELAKQNARATAKTPFHGQASVLFVGGDD
jgi:hypothetical protein